MLNEYLRNGRFLALTIGLLIVLGLAGISSLPRSEDPRISNRLAFVMTPFPGATPERVEALVSEPIENELRRLPEIEDISSISRAGLSVIRIELSDLVYDTGSVWSRARDYLSDVQAELPEGALPSQFHDDRGYAFTLLVSIDWAGPGEPDLAILGRHARELESRLRGVAGTDLVRLFGQPEEEIAVAAQPGRLAALGLTVDAVAEAIGNSDAKVSAGTLRNAVNQMQVEVAGELQSVERIRRIPLRVERSGEVVRVGDVATVSYAIADPVDDIALVEGQRAVVVAVRMLEGQRIDYWRAAVQDTLDRFDAGTTANIDTAILFDQSGYTNQRLGSLVLNVGIGFVLILAVLMVTLGLRAALVVAMALPLTVFFTLGFMKFWGLPIHQMSVTGLVVALGIMVDNAIVMVDLIQSKYREGKRALAAMTEAIGHLWLPLLGSTLTTILAFAPIALMPGPAGEFVGGIALSVIFSLIGSYLISHTVVAGVAGRVFKHCPRNEVQAGFLWRGVRTPRLAAGFRRLLTRALGRPAITLTLILALPAAGFYAMTLMTEQFFPASDRDMFSIELRLPPQSAIDRTEALAQAVSKILQEEPGLERQTWFIGKGAPSFYYNMMSNRDGESHFAQGMIDMVNFEAANEAIPRLQTDLTAAFPQAQVLVRKMEQGPPFAAPIELRIFGPNLDTLNRLGQEARRLLAETPDVVTTRATLESARPKAVVHTREEVSRQTGLERTALARQLEASLSGSVRGSVLEASEELPVRVRVGNERRAGLADLGGLYIATQTGMTDAAGDYAGLSVDTLARIELAPSQGAIPRRNGERLNTVEAFLRADVLPEAVLDQVRQRLSAGELVLPAGYRMEFGGESSGRNDAIGNLMSSVGIILTLLVLVVVLSFNSFRISAIIFSVAGQSVGLGLLCVYAFGYPFGFTVIVGLMGLMGLAINGAIVILAELKSSPAASRGETGAIIQGVMSCTRHITSTTITTVGGFMPLILEGGGFWPPFAIAIAGGTVLTTSLSLVFTPVLFRAMARRRRFDTRVETGPHGSVPDGRPAYRQAA